MIYFDSDYMEGCAPEILRQLTATNTEQARGYGNDDYCTRAKEKIRAACEAPTADVVFLVGGTQTNLTVIDAFLRGYEGVIAVQSAHIAVHESGAIEGCGHKVITLEGKDGKLEAKAVNRYLHEYYQNDTWAHMVVPGMVYISHPTEFGTLYTAEELTQLHQVCQSYHIPLFLDGARLGYGLCANGTDVTLPLIAKCCDVFYIGGTKVGALFGEAVVIPQGGRIPHLFTTVKRRGAVLAKGKLLGLQFDTLFSNGLYLQLSRHAIDMAMKLKTGFAARGYRFYIDSPTNQQFVILPLAKKEELLKSVSFETTCPFDDQNDVVRFVTSWATPEEHIDTLISLL